MVVVCLVEEFFFIVKSLEKQTLENIQYTGNQFFYQNISYNLKANKLKSTWK